MVNKRALPSGSFRKLKIAKDLAKVFISKGLVKHKQAKISDRKEQRFVGIVTPFLSSNALQGLEGYFRDSGFDQNMVRESGKR